MIRYDPGWSPTAMARCWPSVRRRARCCATIYIQSGAIVSPQNQVIGQFPGGTNSAFGGADGKLLLVTGAGRGLHIVQMNLPGLP